MKALVVRVLGSRSLIVPLLVSAAALCHAGPAEDLERCRTLMQTGQHVAALEILDGITAPEFLPQVLQLTADCHKRSQRWDKATASYEKLLALPNSALSPKDLRVSIMDCRFAAGEMGTGYTELDALAKDFPADAPTFHFVVGRRLQWMHQYSDAAKEFRKSLDLAKGDTPGFDEKDLARRYILCSLTASDYDGALSYLPTFARNYPDSIPEVVSKELYRWKFKIPQVIEIIEKAIGSTGRDTTELKIGLADCYVATNSWDKALAVLNGTQTGKPSGNWYAVRAKCYWGQLEFDKAIETLKEAINLNRSVTLQRLLLEYYRDSGDWKNMLAQAELLQKEWPDLTAEWQLNEGWAYLDMKEYGKAIPIFRDVIRRFPDNRNIVRGAMVSLGECLYKLDKGDEAMRELDEYYNSRPELNEERRLTHGMILYHGPRDLAKAEEILRGLAGTSVEYPARLNLLRVLGVQDKWKEAAELRLSMSSMIPDWSPWAKAEALTKVADSYYMGKHYKEAGGVYKGILKFTALSVIVRCQVMLQVARCQKELGYHQSAKTYLYRIITDYPETYAAKQAESLLRVWSMVEAGDNM